MKLVAITGGCGFIGSMLAQKHLKQGDRVRILSRQSHQSRYGLDYFRGDLSDPSLDLRAFVDGVDALYHCAGELINVDLMHQVHVEGTRRLVSAAQNRVDRWVQLSSVGAYGVRRRGIVSEESLEKPASAYENTKTQSDEIVRKSGIPFTIVRPSNVFGVDMPNQSLFQLIEVIRKNRYFHIGRAGSLSNYVHVDDVVEALHLSGSDKHAVKNVYIVSQCIDTELLVNAISEELGIVKPRYRLPEWLIRLVAGTLGRFPGFPLTRSRVDALTSRCRYDSGKIQRDLNFKFTATLEAQCRSLTRKR